jgi:hypothetical protein
MMNDERAVRLEPLTRPCLATGNEVRLAFQDFDLKKSVPIGLVLAASFVLPVIGTEALAQTMRDAKPAQSGEAMPADKKSAPKGAPASSKPDSKTELSAPAPPAAPVALSVPPPEILLMLVRAAVTALNHANITGNYEVLYGLGSPALQQKNTPAQLAAAFTSLRQQGVEMSPVLVLTPQLTQGPVITPEGTLRFAGFFPTKPLQINFEMAYQPVGGRWRLDALSVAVISVAQPASPASGPVGGASEVPANSKSEQPP